MNILAKAKITFGNEIEKIARANIIEKLYKQDIDYLKLSDSDFDSLVEAEKEILESDTKKVGLGIAIGLGHTQDRRHCRQCQTEADRYHRK